MHPPCLRKLPVSSHDSAHTAHHPQFSWLSDTLNRMEQHHALFISHSDRHWHAQFADDFVKSLSATSFSLSCKNPICFYVEADEIIIDLTEIPTPQACIFFIDFSQNTKNNDGLKQLTQWIRQHIQTPQYRFVFFIPPNKIESLEIPHNAFATTLLHTPTQKETYSLLKHASIRLEKHHAVTISHESITLACTLAHRWLSGSSDIQKTLQLLDSAAARAAKNDTNQNTITQKLLKEITSEWSGIPTPLLSEHHFNAPSLTKALRQQVFGQDDAIHHVTRLLQTAGLRLQTLRPGPLCHFLLAGPPFSGKTTLAKSIAQCLYGNTQALLHITASSNLEHMAHAVKNKPYLVILFENINTLPPPMLSAIHAILTTGLFTEPNGHHIDFSETILIFTLATQTIPPQTAAKNETADLMDLVLGTAHSNNSHSHMHLAEGNALSDLLPDTLPIAIKKMMRPVLLNALHLQTIEKIMQHHVTHITQLIAKNTRVSIEMMPEAIHFLSQIYFSRPEKNTIDQLITQRLLPPIAHCLLGSDHTPDPAERIRIRLNNSGEILIGEWTSLQETMLV